MNGVAWLLVAVLVGLTVAWFCAPTGTRGAPELGEAAVPVERATQDATTNPPSRVLRTVASPTHPLTDRLSESALTRAPDGRAAA